MANQGKPAGKIRFLSCDRPALRDGVYEITVSHSFRARASDPEAAIPPVTQRFAVLGPRFRLPPDEVVRKFPPDQTTGRYFHVFPHIQFSRPILPWERCLDSEDPQTPWLVLLLVTRQEIDTWRQQASNESLLRVQTDTLGNLQKAAQDNSTIVFPPSLALEPGESAGDSIDYLDVPEPLLAAILPPKDDLSLLAHVRQSADPEPQPKFPILIGNRLPQPGDENRVFLLSLEGRTDVYERLASYQPGGGSDLVVYRFVVLTSWRFASVDANQSFTELLLAADDATGGSMLRLPKSGDTVLRLPKSGDTEVEGFYEKGYVPLEHQTRQGNRMASWYRGPLLPGPAETTDWPADLQASDQLVRFDATYGMFDVSYAAAWEIGRLLMLRDKRVSVALYNWKRAVAQASGNAVPDHLPRHAPAGPPALPAVVAGWFSALGRLEIVPFNYLVPDERLLPAESLRFFTVDANWVQALLRGAFSIGRTKGESDDDLYGQIPQPPAQQSGFLLRSQVVAGWPHMEIRGYDWQPASAADWNRFVLAGRPALSLTRMQLAPDMILALFDGGLEMVELFEHPETIHFGVDYDAPSCYFKTLRDADGDSYDVGREPCAQSTTTSFTSHWVRIPFQDPATRTVDVSTLARHLQEALRLSTPLTSARLALEMIEGAPLIRFLKGTEQQAETQAPG